MPDQPISLVDPWLCFQQPMLFHRLGLLDLESRWRILNEIRDAEMATPEEQAFASMLAHHFGERLRLSPLLDNLDVDATARRAVWHAQRRTLHLASIFAGFASGQTLDQMVDLSGVDRIQAAVAEYGSAIVLPVHARAIEAAVIVLGRLMPTTLTVSQTAGVPDGPNDFSDLLGPIDVDVLRAPNPNVLVRCVKAVKAGRILVLPPEFTSNQHDRVMRLEVAGRGVGVPCAYVELADRLRIPMFALLMERALDHVYEFEISGPHFASDETNGVPDAISAVFSMVRRVLSEDLAEWEGWYMFDRLIADGERLEHESASDQPASVAQ